MQKDNSPHQPLQGSGSATEPDPSARTASQPASASRNGEAGYKRPPRKTQFKPGQSGNPTGRRSGSRNLRTDVAEVLSGQVVICEGGKERAISRQEAILLSLYHKGVQGDVRAITALLNMGARLLETADAPAPDELSETDLRLLENFLRQNGVLPEGDK
jgi:hypothetical protein